MGIPFSHENSWKFIVIYRCSPSSWTHLLSALAAFRDTSAESWSIKKTLHFLECVTTWENHPGIPSEKTAKTLNGHPHLHSPLNAAHQIQGVGRHAKLRDQGLATRCSGLSHFYCENPQKTLRKPWSLRVKTLISHRVSLKQICWACICSVECLRRINSCSWERACTSGGIPASCGIHDSS